MCSDAWVASQGAEHGNWYDLNAANVNRAQVVFEAYPLSQIVAAK